MVESNQIHASDDSNEQRWNLLVDSPAWGETVLSLLPKTVLENFTAWFTREVESRQPERVQRVAEEKGIPVEEAEVILEPICKAAIKLYVQDAMRYHIEKLSDVVRDASTALFFESVQHAESQMIDRNLQRQDVPDLVVSFASWRRERLIKEALGVSIRAAKTRMNVRKRGGSEPHVSITDEQCVRLATSYQALREIWEAARSIRKDNLKREWRRYVKAEYQNMPDDLLDRLDSPDPYFRKPSAIAHEHAARLCGIAENTYSESSLARLRRRGDKIAVSQVT